MLENEPAIRLASFAGIFLVMALLEALFPRRARRLDRLARWPANFTLTLINSVVLRILFPAAAVGLALQTEANGIGLLNWWVVPGPVEFFIALIALDLAIYVQHILFHRIPVLWRMHRMHHTDLDLDVTSGGRFHPFEIILSMLYKFAVVAALGAPAAAVLLFEVILNACALFNHANLRIPAPLDALLRLLIVTPDMHRVHHSVVGRETNSNFGFNLSCWDRLFGTYVAQPEAGHDGMIIGLAEFQDIGEQRIDRMLKLPLISDPAARDLRD